MDPATGERTAPTPAGSGGPRSRRCDGTARSSGGVGGTEAVAILDRLGVADRYEAVQTARERGLVAR
ncbi:MAG: hypothetical protein EA340_06510 [Nitriliruptor sp.]|nr:MAG: hypothetical protein EA340_06510 [Nitriliruptor sp.]